MKFHFSLLNNNNNIGFKVLDLFMHLEYLKVEDLGLIRHKVCLILVF